MSDSIYDFKVKKIDGTETTLAEFKGKPMLIVNTASKCGFTPQFEGLNDLYKKYHEQGLVILGFPCNQFMNQDPGDEKEIQQFCSLNYDVQFPMFAKIEVNGSKTHPLYEYLKRKARGFLGSKTIKWNFTKFLIDKDGNVLKRFGTKETPKQIEPEIKKVLV